MYLDLCNPTARHHLEKDMDKLEQLQAVCKVYDYGLDYMPPDGEGGGGEFELWSNTHAPGVTGVYETLDQAAVDVAEIVAGGTPL